MASIAAAEAWALGAMSGMASPVGSLGLAGTAVRTPYMLFFSYFRPVSYAAKAVECNIRE